MNKLECLIEILLDKTARVDERDDAAIDLGQYVDDRALQALLQVASNHQENPFIMDVCGESIAQIWVAKNQFEAVSYNSLHPQAKYEAVAYIKSAKPEWSQLL